MTDILTISFDYDESVDGDLPGVCVMRHRNYCKKEIVNMVLGDEAKYIYNVVIGKEKPRTPNEKRKLYGLPSIEYLEAKDVMEKMKTTDATEEECKSVDDYVKSISHKVDLNYEEFVMFLKAVMTDYDFDNFVTLYQDFKENGGELNGWFFDKEE